MTNPSHAAQREPRKLRAVLIGLGFDGSEVPQRIATGDQCLLVGGSEETHAELLETVLRLESELERLGLSLSEVAPPQLAEIAWRIDSPELHEMALRMHHGLVQSGRSFHDSTAEELTELSKNPAEK